MCKEVLVLLFVGVYVCVAQNPLRLERGNIWEYRSTDPLDPMLRRMTVRGDTTMPNGKNYFMLSGSIFASQYVRMDSSRIYAYSFVNSFEFKLYDFLAQPGDTMAILNNGSQRIMLRSRWRDTTVNCNYWYFVFYQGVPPIWYELLEWWIRDGVGVVSLRGEPGMSWYLTGARLGTDTIGVLTNVEVPRNDIPNHFILRQNYPNPFNPTTRIEYAIPKTSHVSLKVFDLLGREVATLVDEVQDVGFKSVAFNAAELASGLYLYRLQAGEFVETRKLLVVR